MIYEFLLHLFDAIKALKNVIQCLSYNFFIRIKKIKMLA